MNSLFMIWPCTRYDDLKNFDTRMRHVVKHKESLLDKSFIDTILTNLDVSFIPAAVIRHVSNLIDS